MAFQGKTSHVSLLAYLPHINMWENAWDSACQPHLWDIKRKILDSILYHFGPYSQYLFLCILNVFCLVFLILEKLGYTKEECLLIIAWYMDTAALRGTQKWVAGSGPSCINPKLGTASLVKVNGLSECSGASVQDLINCVREICGKIKLSVFNVFSLNPRPLEARKLVCSPTR